MSGARCAAHWAAVLTLFAFGAPAAWAATFSVTLLVPADDPRLQRTRVERAALGHPSGPAADGLKMALADGRIELDASGASIALTVVEVTDAAAARAAAAKAEKDGATALVADLPATWLLDAADGTRLPVLNIGATDDRLRQADCRRHVWHLAPSERMRADALAQTLTSRRWTQVLLLAGPHPMDAARAAAAAEAIRRYGLKLVAQRPFKLSADPRERDLANPQLLTQGSYDVVWVVDSDGEFAQSLPYRTALPRPVVGDGGLAALAWSPKFERFGAPQVTRRLSKAAGRPMGHHDWLAWMAGKALVEASITQPKGPAAGWQRALALARLDGSKGTAMSFRAWDGQLRQPLLLTDGQGVIDQAPLEGILHPRDALDTLGADAPEKLCKARA